MNIFGAFTFGSLIKTFLPGFVWLVAFCMLEIDVAQVGGYSSYVMGFMEDNESSALVLAVPASILLGLLSNIIVFMGINDFLVRNPVKTANRELFALHEELSQRLRDRCWKQLGLPETLKNAFEISIDPEVMLIEQVGVGELAYVREQYWYHLEFQLNLMLSLFALFLALLLAPAIKATVGDLSHSVIGGWCLAAILVGGVCWGLIRAAKKNYARHIAKMASLMAALLARPPTVAK